MEYIRLNPNSKIGFQRTLLEQINDQARKYCAEKIEELQIHHQIRAGLKAKFDLPQKKRLLRQAAEPCWYLQISSILFKKHLQAFSDFRVTRK